MPPASVQQFALIPHPSTPSAALASISGQLTRAHDGTLTVTYILTGDIARLRVPTPQPPRFVDELWRHTCCEIFIAQARKPAYHECNFSPSREWAAYAFTHTREHASATAQRALAVLNPHIVVRGSDERLELDAVIRLGRLSPRYTDARLVLALATVIEDRDGALSYWALAHPQAQPDFHHPDAFVLELDEIRN